MANAPGGRGDTLLVSAARKNAVLEALDSAPFDEINAKGEFGMAPVHWVAIHGNKEAMRALKASGADVDAKANDRSTPLMLASAHGHLAMVQLLCDANVDRAARGRGPPRTSLGCANYSRFDDVVAFLRARGAPA